ncbi:hypothetical protein [Microbacterium sp.]|uniref:hypothetical protein n=1 Tax=Microbacterium sp. TaxID=51671 RepID=UPI0039E64F56
MTDAAKVRWLEAPEEHDYPAAVAFLALLAEDVLVNRLVDAFRKAPPTTQKAKDILRASRLPLLGPDNEHVAAELQKVAHRAPLSPILLVRGDLRSGTPLVIADGYHRVCASYWIDENTGIPCRIASLPESASS